MPVDISHLPRASGIYVWRNKKNGKCYVGQAKNIYQRNKIHIRAIQNGSTQYIHNAVKKHGADAFDVVVQELCAVDNLSEREMYWIAELKTFKPNGYNLTIGGETNPMVHPEARAKHLAYLQSPEGKAILVATAIRTNSRPEIKAAKKAKMASVWEQHGREAMIASIKNAWEDPELKARASASQVASLARPEVKKRQSEGVRAAFLRPDVKARHRAAIDSPEVKAKIKATNELPETKARRSAAVKKAMNRQEVRESRQKIYDDPEFKAKLSKSQKENWSREETRENQKAALNRPDVRAKMVARSRAIWDDPVKKAELLENRKKIKAAKTYIAICAAWINLMAGHA